jgi:hypothetical protein
VPKGSVKRKLPHRQGVIFTPTIPPIDTTTDFNTDTFDIYRNKPDTSSNFPSTTTNFGPTNTINFKAENGSDQISSQTLVIGLIIFLFLVMMGTGLIMNRSRFIIHI